ncbi:hypothetical protein BH11PLA1_BH11PLA1_13640 [soil metagenome]
MRRALRFSPRFVEQLQGVLGLVAREQPAAAKRLGVRVEHALELISDYPEIGRVRPELGPVERSLLVGSWNVIYRPAANHLVMLAFIHAHQDLHPYEFDGIERGDPPLSPLP